MRPQGMNLKELINRRLYERRAQIDQAGRHAGWRSCLEESCRKGPSPDSNTRPCAHRSRREHWDYPCRRVLVEDQLIPIQSGLDRKTKPWVQGELASSWALRVSWLSGFPVASRSRPTWWGCSMKRPKGS